MGWSGSQVRTLFFPLPSFLSASASDVREILLNNSNSISQERKRGSPENFASSGPNNAKKIEKGKREGRKRHSALFGPDLVGQQEDAQGQIWPNLPSLPCPLVDRRGPISGGHFSFLCARSLTREKREREGENSSTGIFKLLERPTFFFFRTEA